MPKNNEQVSLKCPSCGGERFQVHERGKFVIGADESVGLVGLDSFVLDEIACHCLQCHTVSFLHELVK